LQYSLKRIYNVGFDIEATGTKIPWFDCIANCDDYCVGALAKKKSSSSSFLGCGKVVSEESLPW